jgi:hypothetical protein
MAHGPDTDELLRLLANVRQHWYEFWKSNNLSIVGYRITSLPLLPHYLLYLNCSHTQIRELPILPSSLISLNCINTPITELPSLPSSLKTLLCNDTQITEFPPLPPTLKWLGYKNCPNLLIKPIEGKRIQDYEQRWKPIREEQKMKREELESKQRCVEHCLTVKEELMAAAWHPRRVERWINECGIEVLD